MFDKTIEFLNNRIGILIVDDEYYYCLTDVIILLNYRCRWFLTVFLKDPDVLNKLYKYGFDLSDIKEHIFINSKGLTALMMYEVKENKNKVAFDFMVNAAKTSLESRADRAFLENRFKG